MATTVSATAADAICAAADRERERQEADDTARRHLALHMLPSCVSFVTATLKKMFEIDATFELADSGYLEDKPSWFYEYAGERVYSEHDIVLAGWMVVAGTRVADVRARTSVLYPKDGTEVVVHVPTPRWWWKSKRTEVRTISELRAALDI